MPDTSTSKDLKKLHKDLKEFDLIGEAAQISGRPVTKYGIVLLFMAIVLVISLFQSGDGANSAFIIVAGLLGAYMALNIGANDVANNIGPAVGSKALTMVGALVIAAVFEAAGAIFAGGDVVKTISKGIIAPELMPDTQTFILAMMSALMAAAIWVNVATYIGAPVSTTHAVVGGVMGGGIAATGFSAVNWVTMGKIAASWVISPFLGGVVAALFLAFIKYRIIFQEDRVAAAKRWVPVLVSVMVAVFSMYLMKKGLKKIWKPDWWVVAATGAALFAASVAIIRPIVAKAAEGLENRRKAVSELFTIPLICSAALLSFAHGANDVANAIGPLAAIVGAASTGEIVAKVHVPLWVMGIGAAGISAGLMLFGPKLVRMVGEKITKLDRLRAFCVALSAAITVIVASALGLPVSSTHIAVGAVFGVGFYREFLDQKQRAKKRAEREATLLENIVLQTHGSATNNDPTPKEIKKAEKAKRRKLVRRQHLVTIVSAWLVTVPLAALLASALFMSLNGFLGER